MNILLILHTYAANGELGSFAKELVQGFQNTGANIHVIKTNDLVGGLGGRRYSANLDTGKLRKLCREIRFDMVFTTNHGGINEELRKLTRNAPIVSWMVDRNPFKHNGYLNQKIFYPEDHIITSSTVNVPSLVEKFDLRKDRVHYLPFMTNPRSFSREKSKDINISFIGSYFLNESIIYNAFKVAEGTKYYAPLLETVRQLEEDFDVNENELIRRNGLSGFLLAQRVTKRHFKGAVGNMLSNRKRLEYLSAVAGLGLELYGTRNLAELISFSPRVSACFNMNYFVNTRERLVDIYDRSRIGLNINHHQATSGLGYRVFDIMCSSALLVSNYQKQSDLDVLFGKDHPIPIYKSGEELQEICRYFFEHEAERAELSARCQQLIGDTHTFDTRACEIIQIVEPSFQPADTIQEVVFYTPNDLWTEQSLKAGPVHTSAGLPRLAARAYLPKLLAPLKTLKRKS